MSVKKTKDFKLTEEMVENINNFLPADEDLVMSKICAMINTLVEDEEMRKVQAATITGWLESVGVLEMVVNAEGIRNRLPTFVGLEIGLKTEEVESDKGVYTKVTYTPRAQKFIFKNISYFKEYLDNQEESYQTAV